jgi:hypothetical protein
MTSRRKTKKASSMKRFVNLRHLVGAALIGVTSIVLLEVLSIGVYLANSYFTASSETFLERTRSLIRSVGFVWHEPRDRLGETLQLMDRDPLMGYRPRPLAAYHSSDLVTGAPIWPLYTDRYGFIANRADVANEEPPRQNGWNVVITGNSVTQGGAATSNERTFSAVLETLLNDVSLPNGAMPPARVINAGVGGYNSTQEVTYLLTELQYLNPKVVVMFSGIGERLDLPTYGREFHVPVTLSKEPLDALPLPILPATQNLLLAVQRRLGGGEAKEALVLEWTKRKPSERFAGNIAVAAAIARNRGAAFVFVLQPTLAVGGERHNAAELERGRLTFGSNPQNWETYAARMSSFYGEVLTEMSRLARLFPEAQFLDGSGWFDGEEREVYWDPRHYTDLGHRIVAERIFGAIQDIRRADGTRLTSPSSGN